MDTRKAYGRELRAGDELGVILVVGARTWRGSRRRQVCRLRDPYAQRKHEEQDGSAFSVRVDVLFVATWKDRMLRFRLGV
jgi:hypothetical protein